jgi:hypothetical protein
MYVELSGGTGVRAVLGFGQAISSAGSGRGFGKVYEWDRETGGEHIKIITA